jgi:hypothetical protein
MGYVIYGSAIKKPTSYKSAYKVSYESAATHSRLRSDQTGF